MTLHWSKPQLGFIPVVARGCTEPDPSQDFMLDLEGNVVRVPQGKPIQVADFEKSSFSKSEYLLYKESQARIRYMLTMKFNHRGSWHWAMPLLCWRPDANTQLYVLSRYAFCRHAMHCKFSLLYIYIQKNVRLTLLCNSTICWNVKNDIHQHQCKVTSVHICNDLQWLAAVTCSTCDNLPLWLAVLAMTCSSEHCFASKSFALHEILRWPD